ncbi:MAG: cytochrome c biogenesis protein CcsA [Bacteroidales bacterium]|nr:cytochrome c biogenesis protein CcsA [Bacteroidales bacterium]
MRNLGIHLLFILVLALAVLGGFFSQTLYVTLAPGESSSFAADANGRPVALDWSLKLDSFTVLSYPDGSPKRYTSVITLDGSRQGTVEVNRPLRFRGWLIYQYDYYTLMLVRRPLLPVVYLGFILLLTAALLQLIIQAFKGVRRRGLLAGLLLTLVFVLITFLRMGSHARTLPPALQSPWFVPHIVVYMLAYALLSIAIVIAVYQWIKGSFNLEQADRFTAMGASLLLAGMVMGAIWAQAAWGTYWNWDPKETFALVTWLLFMLYLHWRRSMPDSRRWACIILLLAFISLQFCWWGVNLFPSVHSYTQSAQLQAGSMVL